MLLLRFKSDMFIFASEMMLARLARTGLCWLGILRLLVDSFSMVEDSKLCSTVSLVTFIDDGFMKDEGASAQEEHLSC